MKTKITELFSIDFPLIAGGMIWCSGWELASAVSNCGGLGLIGAGSMTPEVLEEHILKCRQATSRPFGVNIPLMNPNSGKHIECVIKHQVPVVFTSAGNPALHTARLKEAGCKVVHVVANEKFALKAQNAGCDAVVAEGFEAGGHNGREETTTMALIPQVRKATSLPLIAAGGIGSGRAILAAQALGAEGVQIGTLFALAEESSAAEAFKEKCIAMAEGDTMLCLKKLAPTRLVKNELYSRIAEAEARGANAEELRGILGQAASKRGIFEGDVNGGELEIGQVASTVNKILPVAEIMENLVADYHSAMTFEPLL